jgi:hypothetical protein
VAKRLIPEALARAVKELPRAVLKKAYIFSIYFSIYNV